MEERQRTTPPDWNEQRNITLKVDRFTLGVVCLLAAVIVFVWTRKLHALCGPR